MSLLLVAVCAQAQITPQQWRDSVSTLIGAINKDPKNVNLRLLKAEGNINLRQWDYAVQEYGYVLQILFR